MKIKATINKYRVEALLLLIEFFVMFFYYSRDWVVNYSDLSEHIVIAKNYIDAMTVYFKEANSIAPVGTTYPVWFLLYCGVYSLCSSESIALGIVNGALVTLFTASIIYAFNSLCLEYISKRRKLIYAIIITFVGPLFVKAINPMYYLGQITPNPWHNSTTFVVRPVGVLCMVFLFKIIMSKGICTHKYYILFAVSLAVSNFCKPSFAQSFIPALIVFCVILLFSKKTNFKFLQCIYLGLACVPCVLVMLFQYLILNSSYQLMRGAIVIGRVASISYGNISTIIDKPIGGAIGISPFKVWSMYSDHIVGSIIISYAFIIVVCFFTYKLENLRVFIYFIISSCIGGIFPVALLYMQSGTRNFDFMWGAHLMIGLGYIAACALLMNSASHMKRYQYIICNLFLGLHFVYGLCYFLKFAYNHDIFMGLY